MHATGKIRFNLIICTSIAEVSLKMLENPLHKSFDRNRRDSFLYENEVENMAETDLDAETAVNERLKESPTECITEISSSFRTPNMLCETGYETTPKYSNPVLVHGSNALSQSSVIAKNYSTPDHSISKASHNIMFPAPCSINNDYKQESSSDGPVSLPPRKNLKFKGNLIPYDT